MIGWQGHRRYDTWQYGRGLEDIGAREQMGEKEK